jgi:hypothetical protein
MECKHNLIWKFSGFHGPDYIIGRMKNQPFFYPFFLLRHPSKAGSPLRFDFIADADFPAIPAAAGVGVQ